LRAGKIAVRGYKSQLVAYSHC